MVILSAIGDITRFATDKNLVGYAGLGAGVHDSGQTHHTGHITKQGRTELRHALVEAAWVAVRTHPHWQEQYQRLAKRMPVGKASVAIARKLLVVIWHVLSERTADRQAKPDQVAAKLLVWSGKLGHDLRGDLTPRQFVRYQLMHLDLGHNLIGFRFGGQERSLATEEELLALKPELQTVN